MMDRVMDGRAVPITYGATRGHIQYETTASTSDSRTRPYCEISDRLKAYKNLFGLCTSFICCFGAFIGILNLQSSINSAGGLGLASNSTLYVTFLLCATFFPLYVRRLGNKLAMLTGLVGLLLYSCCNYYPNWYTLITGSVIAGVATGPVWVGMYSQATLVATEYSSALKEETKNAVSLFTGWIAAATKLSRVAGSLVSSIVLITIKEPAASNSTAMSREIVFDDDNRSAHACNHHSNVENSNLEKDFVYYLLVSLYVVMGIVGIAVVLFTVDRMETKKRNKSQSFSKVFVNAIGSLLSVLFTYSMRLLLPLCVMNGLLLGFIAGMFPEVYISDCLGVEWIGFLLAGYGMVGTVFAVASGRLVKYIPQFVFVYASLLACLSLTITLLLWERERNFYIIVGLTAAFGASEAVINAAIPGLLGVLFNKNKEPAFTLFQVGIAFGQVVSFSCGLILSTRNQIFVLLSFTVLSLLCYTLLLIEIWSS